MEQVTLLDESGRFLGVADKATVHHKNTPLHLAFSCYVFNPAGELLITQRAIHKRTWPGVWTNSCCGHPAPAENLTRAVSRRLHEELRLTPTRLDLVLPRFSYRAEMPNGVVENEVCPVFRAVVETEPCPDPREVREIRWVSWDGFTHDVRGGRFAVSPWCQLQVTQLVALGAEPGTWPRMSDEHLPPAARMPS